MSGWLLNCQNDLLVSEMSILYYIKNIVLFHVLFKIILLEIHDIKIKE